MITSWASNCQARARAQGRTAPGGIVTNAKTLGGPPAWPQGAVDLWPYKPESVEAGAFEPDFDVDSPETLARYQAMGEAGKRMGLIWGGDFKKLKDFPHFEVPDWRGLPYPPPLLEVS
ncbi:MAG TPA: M15 family metallopeptidase [Myxococcaceae bacterium]|nr:M15 family metallopeptidase [Myxococcaceae bacterium]